MSKRFIYTAMLIAGLFVAMFIGLATQDQGAVAGPVITGNPEGAQSRELIADGESGQVTRIRYFAAGVKTMANTTPVASDPFCSLEGDLHRADVKLTGTMAGTAPTLAVKWQNSIDGGTTWIDVGTWTTINATVTPASQSQVVSDIVGSTAVAYGDCWRATYVFGGSGTVTANISITGIEK